MNEIQAELNGEVAPNGIEAETTQDWPYPVPPGGIVLTREEAFERRMKNLEEYLESLLYHKGKIRYYQDRITSAVRGMDEGTMPQEMRDKILLYTNI